MPEVAQGSVPTQTIVAGNTIAARNFTVSLNAVPAAITSARVSFRDAKTYRYLYSDDCTVVGGVVTRPVVASTETTCWPIGTESVSWDCEVILTAGLTEKTWFRGYFTVKRTDQ